MTGSDFKKYVYEQTSKKKKNQSSNVVDTLAEQASNLSKRNTSMQTPVKSTPLTVPDKSVNTKAYGSIGTTYKPQVPYVGSYGSMNTSKDSLNNLKNLSVVPKVSIPSVKSLTPTQQSYGVMGATSAPVKITNGLIGNQSGAPQKTLQARADYVKPTQNYARYASSDNGLNASQIISKYKTMLSDPTISDYERNILAKQGAKAVNRIATNNVTVPFLNGGIQSSENERKQAIELANTLRQSTQAGAFGSSFFNQMAGGSAGSTIRKAIADKIGAPDNLDEAVQTGNTAQPGAALAGNELGNAARIAALYGINYGINSAPSDSTEIVPYLNNLKNTAQTSSGKNVVSSLLKQQAFDTVFRTPDVIAKGINDGKSTQDIIKDVGKQQFVDFLFNLAFTGVDNIMNHMRQMNVSGMEGFSPENSKYFQGVETPEEATRRYRNAARTLHPDVNPDPDATSAFQDLSDEWVKTQKYFSMGKYAPGSVSYEPAAPVTPQEPVYASGVQNPYSAMSSEGLSADGSVTSPVSAESALNVLRNNTSEDVAGLIRNPSVVDSLNPVKSETSVPFLFNNPNVSIDASPKAADNNVKAIGGVSNGTGAGLWNDSGRNRILAGWGKGQPVLQENEGGGTDGRANSVVAEKLRLIPELNGTGAQMNGSINPDNVYLQSANSYGQNTVGAAQVNPNSFSHLVNQNDAIEPGENPDRIVDVPKLDANGKPVSRFSRTAMESNNIPDTMVPEMENQIAEGKFSYTPTSNADQMKTATSYIEKNGHAAALARWETSRDAQNSVSGVVSSIGQSADDVAIAEQLLVDAGKAGDTDTVMRLAAELSIDGSTWGQKVQALRLLKKMGPTGQVYGLQETVNKINKQVASDGRIGKRKPSKKSGNILDVSEIDGTQVTLNKDLVDQFLKADSDEARDEIIEKIKQNIADQLPEASLAEKWNAWRYMSMLNNFKTHGRNIIGNAAMLTLSQAQNAVKAGIEAIASKTGADFEKTAAIIVPKSLKEFADKDVDSSEVLSALKNGGSKYDELVGDIYSKRRIFNTSLLEVPRVVGSKALENEDLFFKKIIYKQSLSRYLAANKIDPGKASEDVMMKARAYAIQKAYEDTFNDKNTLASFLNQASRTNGAAELMIGGIMPFKRTPANVAKQSWYYSPAGLVQGMVEFASGVKNGNDASKAIDHLSKGVPGTILAVIGALMAKYGILEVYGSESDREEDYSKMTGHQKYAINLPGNGNYTIDWLSPSAVPLLLGANAYKVTKGTVELRDLIDVFSSLFDPMVDTSYLQGPNNTLKSIAYNGGNAFAPIIETAVTGYFSQAVPGILGQLARTVDDTRRVGSYNDKNSNIPKVIQNTFGKNASKIPFVSASLPAYVDAWGRKDVNESLAGRAFENFLSPGYYSKVNVTKADEAVKSIYDSTGDSSVLPTAAAKSFAVDGNTINLTGKQYEQFQTQKGQTQFDIVTELADNDLFNSMPDTDKAKLISDVYSYATSVAKASMYDYKLTGKDAKIQAAIQAGISPAQYLTTYYEADDNKQGGASSKEMGNYLSGSNMTNEQKGQMYYSSLTADQQKKADQAKSAGVPYFDYYYFKSMADKDKNGTVSKSEAVETLNGMNLSKNQKNQLLFLQNKSWKSAW